MIKKIFIALIILLQSSAFAQEKLVKDLDFDGKNDTVYIDQNEYRIVCRLSTQKFKKIKSKPLEIYSDQSYIAPAKNGFYWKNNWMRAGNSCQFRYEKAEKRIRLIGISDYAFGNAANDGSGEASVNLLTGDYLGEWHYFDHLANKEEGELVKVPVKAKLKFTKRYLEDFETETYYNIQAQISPLIEKEQKLIKNRRAKIKKQ